MKIGVVGYQGSGKSTLFSLLTHTPADPALAHATQSAMAPIPDPRFDGLVATIQPKKRVQAALEIVDTPGLSRTHEGSGQRLAMIKEAGCLALVVGAFGGGDPRRDAVTFEDDALLADLEIVSGRVERLRESVKKPRNREQDQAELDALTPLLATLEDGKPLTGLALSDEQKRYIRAFQLITGKPRVIVVNTDDDEADPQRFVHALGGDHPVFAGPLRMQWELAQMPPEERAEFEQEMGGQSCDLAELIRTLMDASGQMLFFTASEKEVRTWLIPKGATALMAADSIHSDLARGFIRAETMRCDDMIELGGEKQVKAAGKMRQEPKDYVVQEGDVLHIRFNV